MIREKLKQTAKYQESDSGKEEAESEDEEDSDEEEALMLVGFSSCFGHQSVC